MIYAIVAAGGSGTRMGSEIPKQFLKIKDKPILIYSVEKLLANDRIDKALVICPKEYIAYTEEIIDEYIGQTDSVAVIAGGATRNETLMNGVDFIEREYGLDDKTIVVTHDAVRPFLTDRMITENIDMAIKYSAVDTVFPVTDTIVVSTDGATIDSVPPRSTLYYGQTPQTFNAKKLRELYRGLDEKKRETLTDGCSIFTLSGEKVYLVRGEEYNIKITYPSDLKFAESFLDK